MLLIGALGLVPRLSAARAANDAAVSILSLGSHGVELTVRTTPDVRRSPTAVVPGLPDQTWSYPGVPGEPMLPWRRFYVGLPAQAVWSVDWDAAEVVPIAGQVASVEGDAWGEGRGQEVEVEGEGWIRDMRVISLVVRPYTVRPTGLALAQRVTVRIGWDRDERGPGAISDCWDGLYRQLLANYHQARSWRSSPPSVPVRSWVPPTPAIKLYVDRAGLYRLDRDWWSTAGVDPTSVNPHTVRLLTRGQELAIWVSGQEAGADTTWDADDALIFYGGFNPREDQEGRRRPIEGEYTAENVYWLTWGGESGARLEERDVTPSGQPPTAQFYRSTVRAECDSVAPYGGRSGIDLTEIHWFWRWFLAGGPYHSEVFPLTVGNLVPGEPATLRVRMRGYSQTGPWGPHHHTELLLNGEVVCDSAWGDPGGRDWFFLETTVPSSWIQDGVNELEVRLYPDAQDEYASAICFDWWELDFARRYVAIGDSLTFYGPLAPQGTYRFRIEGITSDSVEIFELTTPVRLFGHRASAGVLTFDMQSSGGDTLAALGRDRLGYPPRWVWDVPPEHLLASPDGQASHLIVAYDPSTAGAPLPNLYNAAVELYQFRNTTVPSRLVDVQDVYDEFSHGVFHPPAIRDFSEYAFHNWPQVPLRSLLLFGDANYDYRGFISTGVNFVPSIGNPPNDNMFACLTSDTTGAYDDCPDIWVGRIPASSEADAHNLVDKVISYSQDPPACAVGENPWKKNVLFVAGSGEDQFLDPIHTKIDSFVTPPPMLGYADSVFRAGAGDYEPLYYNWQIREALNEGRIALDYFGHAGGTTMGVMFDSVDADSLQNGDRLPFAVAVTCYLGHFAEPDSALLGEKLLRSDSPEHGAIAVWTSTGLSGNCPPANYAVFKSLFVDFPSGDPLAGTFGHATLASKLVGYRNQYVLLGDPEAVLALPSMPDLTVFPEEIEVIPDSLGVLQDATVRFRLRNLGSAASVESCLARLRHEPPGGSSAILWQGATAVPRSAEEIVIVGWTTPDTVGLHRLVVEVDPEGIVPEEREDNNVVAIEFPVLHQAPFLCQPMRYALLDDSAPVLAVRNIDPRDGCVFQYIFELSPNESFNPAASGYQSSGFLVEGLEGTTSWEPAALVDGTTYFWRSRVQEQGNPGAWMSPGSFTVSLGQDQGWHQTERLQFAEDSLSATDSDGAPGSVILLSEIGLLDYATEAEGATAIVSSAAPGCDPRGLIGSGYFCFADGDQDQWVVVSWAEDRLLSHLGSRQMAGSVERGVWSYYRVDTSTDSIAWSTWCELGPFEAPALENIPPIMYCDSLPPMAVRHVRYRFGRCDLSGKGSYIKKVFAKTRSFADSGCVLSPPIGPAWQWGWFSWDEILPVPETFQTCDLLGQGQGGQTWEAIPGWQGLEEGSSLSALDAEAFPRLRLRANLATADSIYSPSLESWTVTFDPALDVEIREDDVIVQPSAVPPGDTLQITGGVRNSGLVTVDSVGLALFTSDGDSLDALGDTTWLPLLPPGDGVWSVSFPWISSQGVHELLLWVDPADLIAEVDEVNNTAAVQIKILSDLMPDSLWIVPAVPVEGDTATLLCRVMNAGVLPCSSWVLGLTVMPTGWSTETLGCGLEAGEGCSLSIAWPTPPTAGQCTLQVTCDPGDHIEEGDEANNSAALVTRIVTKWDFQALDLAFSNPAPPEGDPITLAALVGNAGESPAESVEVAFWDGDPGTGALIGSAWARSLGGLDSALVEMDWPTAGMIGAHEIWFSVDPNNAWEESREDNNDTMAVVVVDTLPDLLIPHGGVLLEPDSVLLGDELQVTGIVRNSSFAGAGPFDVAWWLGSSTDSLLSQLAPETTLAGLAGTSEETLRLTFASGTEGDAWAVLLLDLTDAVHETNESNNRDGSRFMTLPLPDLSVTRSDIAFSNAQPLEGDTVEVTVWVHNLSTTPTGAFAVSVWDGDPAEEASVEIHRVAGVQLDSLATAERRFPWWPGYEPGDHDVWVVADVDDEVEESSEANNVAWTNIQVLRDTLAPQLLIRSSVAGFRDGDFLGHGDTLCVSVVDRETGPDTTSVCLSLNGTALPPDAWRIATTTASSLAVYYPVGYGHGSQFLEASVADMAGNQAANAVRYLLADGLALGDVCAFPNPFSDVTSILVPLSRSADVRVRIMTLAGRSVRVLRQHLAAPFGALEWDGRDEDGDQVAGGVYLYVVKADDGRERATFLGKIVRMPG